MVLNGINLKKPEDPKGNIVLDDILANTLHFIESHLKVVILSKLVFCDGIYASFSWQIEFSRVVCYH